MSDPGQRLRAALAQLQRGGAAAAEAELRQALTAAPEHAGLRLLLGRLLRQRDAYAEAEAELARAAALAPEQPQVHAELGYLALQRGDDRAAVAHFDTLVALRPDFADGHYNRGEALKRLGRIDAAVEAFRRALAAGAARPADIHCELGSALTVARREAAARVEFERAVELAPDSAAAHYGLGVIDAAYGEFDAALARFRRALELDPNFVEVYQQLAAVKRFERADDEDLLAMERALNAPGLAPLAREKIHFALGKSCDDLQAYPQAFEHYRAANELQAARLPAFAAAAHAACVDRLIEFFTAPRMADAPVDDAGAWQPLFVIGLPRSGTTLLEQMLSRHPRVAAGGENTTVEALTRTELHPYPDAVAALESVRAHALAASYRDSVERFRGDAVYVVDKYPANFLHVGLIRHLFPKARILHCCREPLDTCLSIYLQDFPSGNRYANRLEDIGAYFKDYRRLLAHWHATAPEHIFDVSYEALVTEPEATLRGVLAHCGLAWDPACLDPRGGATPVATQSRWQVRQPLYSGSIQRWRRYATQLAPLRALLAEGPG